METQAAKDAIPDSLLVFEKEIIMMVSICPQIHRMWTISHPNFPRSFKNIILYNLNVVLLV